MTTTRRHESPRISANELAKYMVASETGKLGIIRRAKESGTAGRVRYSDVKDALKAGMADPVNERRILAVAGARFEQQKDDPASSPWYQEDAAKSVDVLQSYAGMRNQLAGMDYQPAPSRMPKLQINGVAVSVQLDLLIHRDARTGPQIGGLIFRMTKPDEEESEGAASTRRNMGLYVATLAHMQIAANFSTNRTPTKQLCWSVDIQAGDRHVCPNSILNRQNDLSNACMFIAALWDRV